MPINYCPRIVTDGITLYLDAGNIKSYSGSGTTWTDISSKGNNGTLTNGPTFNSDNIGSIVFDGTDDVVTATDAGLPSSSNPRSISAWVKNTRVNQWKSIVHYGGSSNNTANFFSIGNTADGYKLHMAAFNNTADGSTDATGRGANEPDFKTFSNKPIIMKDYYEVSGSDVARIGWVEVAAEDGQSGYLWYLKAEADTRARFTDYLEMAMLESELGVHGTDDVDDFLGAARATAATGQSTGTEGLFAAIESRGNITTGVTGVNAATDLAEFDAILAEFDKQGAIEENMMFVNRQTSLAMDDMLASMNSYGAGGTSYGVFDNSEDMALNLGFSGFRRGSYDFYKSDFRYLNDKATRGGINDAATIDAIRGVIIPAGTSTVYDQMLGKNLKRPFLHVRFRASQTDDRRMKTWVTGSVGAATSALDAMQIHMLTERCLVTQGANNFMLMK